LKPELITLVKGERIDRYVIITRLRKPELITIIMNI